VFSVSPYLPIIGIKKSFPDEKLIFITKIYPHLSGTILQELAPRSMPVAGFHRALPSTSLDKVTFIQFAKVY